MGMYDTINGWQVKCFPWVSLYEGEISYHGGDLNYYGTGDAVPYRKPHYNYGKNFIILDINMYPESEYSDYDYILHVIVDGKVQNTFVDTIGDIDWSANNLVVGYRGELFNINSSEDVLNYIKDQRRYWDKWEEIHTRWNELFAESMEYFTGLGLLDKESEESKFRREKIDELHVAMEEESKRIQPEITAAFEEIEHWGADTSNIEDLITLGDFISVHGIREDTRKERRRVIEKMLAADETLYDRYVEWQGTDEYIKGFRG